MYLPFHLNPFGYRLSLRYPSCQVSYGFRTTAGILPVHSRTSTMLSADSRSRSDFLSIVTVALCKQQGLRASRGKIVTFPHITVGYTPKES
jgi:hypothetical protein